jgi:hypothetical protein
MLLTNTVRSNETLKSACDCILTEEKDPLRELRQII